MLSLACVNFSASSTPAPVPLVSKREASNKAAQTSAAQDQLIDPRVDRSCAATTPCKVNLKKVGVIGVDASPAERRVSRSSKLTVINCALP
eukprot:1947689-Pleurochrysis_carterae.AAC.1